MDEYRKETPPAWMQVVEIIVYIIFGILIIFVLVAAQLIGKKQGNNN